MDATILKRIVAKKRIEIRAKKHAIPLRVIALGLKKSVIPPLQTLFPRGGETNIIGEIKRKSPSTKRLVRDEDLPKIARLYRKHCVAVSVLTDQTFFGGSLQDIEKVKQLAGLPILQKDFIIDEYQIYEARQYGADCVLLIAAILNKRSIRHLMRIAKRFGMHALVEVHTLYELKKALRAGAELIGINSRNLKTFSIDLKVVEKIAPYVPKNKIVIAESGIHSRKDIETLRPYVRGFLVGTSILKSSNPERLLRSLVKT